MPDKIGVAPSSDPKNRQSNPTRANASSELLLMTCRSLSPLPCHTRRALRPSEAHANLHAPALHVPRPPRLHPCSRCSSSSVRFQRIDVGSGSSWDSCQATSNFSSTEFMWHIALTFKHITCFQLHDASKWFPESFVALPFSQWCCGEVV